MMQFQIGTTRRGRPLKLDAEERSRHLHLVGVSGTGKSKLLETMIRQDIIAGRGLCLIDPHGTLADAAVAFCANRGFASLRRIHVVEPADATWTFGFNPLELGGTIELSVRVDAMVNACAQVWGGENTANTPLLKKCLRAVFHVLAIREQTLVEAIELTSSTDPYARRRMLTDGLPDYVFDALWQDFNRLSRREFAEQFSSTNNRLLEFLSSPQVRRIVGQRERALDLRSMMDNGEILIVNLAQRGALSADNARLLGTLITSELFLQARSRDEATAKRRPFYLYIDECYDYLTSDIEKMLDQTRKFGLHLVLAHQRLGQLRERSEAIYNGVMAGGQTKIVFGGLADDDADVMARHVLRDSFNLERPKHILDKPVVVDEVPYWLESQMTAESEGTARTAGESAGWAEASGSSDSAGESFRLLPDGTLDQTGVVENAGTFASEMRSGVRSLSLSEISGRTVTTGRSETLKPVRVSMPTAVYSLEEELHRAIVKLRELPKRSAIFKRVGRPAIRLRTLEVKTPLATPAVVERFMERVRSKSPYVSPAAFADAEILTRQSMLTPPTQVASSAGEDRFWQEEE
jgi:Helicase HerA, central domain